MEKTLEQAVSEIIDSWVEELIAKLRSGSFTSPQRGLWDRLKGGMYNLFYGRTGERAKKYNPYYNRNRFGDDLGTEEEVKESLTLADYIKIKSIVEEAEKSAESLLILETEEATSRLRIFGILRSAARDLKSKLIPIVSKYYDGEEAASISKTADADEDSSKASGSREIDSAAASPAPKSSTTTTTTAAPKSSITTTTTATPADSEKNDSAEDSLVKRIYGDGKTREEIISAIQEKLIQPVRKAIDRSERNSFKMNWSRYVDEVLPQNVDELKDALELELFKKVSEFSGLDEKEIEKMI